MILTPSLWFAAQAHASVILPQPLEVKPTMPVSRDGGANAILQAALNWMTVCRICGINIATGEFSLFRQAWLSWRIHRDLLYRSQ